MKKQFSMFSTYSKVENLYEIVENYRKTDVFAWKTVGIYVDKQAYVENLRQYKAESVVPSAFQPLLVKSSFRSPEQGKAVEKKFFDMENYVENVTKPRKIVIFKAFQAGKRGFDSPHLVLTY